MRYLQRAWHYVLIEPYVWLFYSFFQPSRFKREYESKGLLHRMITMLRLALPMFLLSYPLALLVYAIGEFAVGGPASLVWMRSLALDTATLTKVEDFLLAVALATLLGILWSILWGIASGIAGGIAWGLTLSMAGGHIAASGIIGDLSRNTLWGIATCMVFGFIGGIAGSIARPIAKIRGFRVTVRIGGIAGGIAGAIVGSIVNGMIRQVKGIETSTLGIILSYLADWIYIASAIAGGVAEIIAGPMAEKRGMSVTRMAIRIGGIIGLLVGSAEALNGIFFSHIPNMSLWGWAIVIIGNTGVGIVGGIVGHTILDIVETPGRSNNMIAGLMVLIAGGLFFGIASISLTRILGITLMIIMGTLLGIVRPSTISIILGIAFSTGRVEKLVFLTLDITEALKESVVLVLCFIIGRFRLPLYPVSAFSAFTTYLSSRTNPREVFTHLHRSSLYWDERVYLPLPGLKHTLLIAAEQNVERTLEEISFILAERPQQIGAARAASLEIAIHDLEMSTNLQEIADASQRLNDILPQDAGLVDPRWVTPFARLSDASRDAARACSPLGWQARRTALREMIADLKKVYPNTAFTEVRLNARLGEIVKTWRAVAQLVLEEMERAPEKTTRIGNPYNPGPVLERRNSLFVGRRDLAQQLEDALGRGKQRPTFLLHGERRLGKSSTLKQLPDLLGARYLPIFYDLQIRGFSSNIAVFLGKIADEIYKVMRARGLPAKKLPYERLQDAIRRNEAEVYHRFEQWLEEIEWTLEQEDRTLLLTFDEFEKLEAAGREGYLNLGLLLDWFRSVIQNHPRLALLFSGVRNFSDMGANWAGYFVNVQTLKISFLRSDEAYQLITRPVPNFPGEQIFDESVIKGIMRVTNRHPFLVQAVCSALLDSLNAYNRNRIEPYGVGVAANQVLQHWGNYFQDQWYRTDNDQRACVLALNRIGESNLQRIEQHSGLHGMSVHRALETLLDRDIVAYENGMYKIAVPLFGVWVQRNNSR